MRDYAITTDSSCDFDQALADSLGVTVVPLSVQIGPRRFRNAPGEAMDSHSFYQLLSQGELAQTSAPNVEEFKAVWRPILQSGRDLLYLGFSSGLSGTYHNAAIAAEDLREEFPEARIITVDTLCASLGQGMLVDLTVQEKRQGKTLDEAAAFAEKNRLYLCHWFTVGDLSQLRRGGRLSAGKAIVGNLLNIKPVLHVDDEGHLVPMASAKGRKKSIEALVSHMEESAVAPEQQRVYISHGDCLADAELLAQMVRDRLHVSSVTIGDVGPVIGAHSGAGTLALFFVGSLPVLAVTLAVMMHIGQPRFRKMLLKMDELNRAIQENLINSRVVKAFVRGDYESERFAGTVEDLRHAQLSSARLFTLTGPIQMGIMWTCTVLLLLFGGGKALLG